MSDADGGSWSVAIDTLSGTVAVLGALAARHDYLIAQNYAFDRNFAALLQGAAGCLAHLGAGTTMAVADTAALSAEYVEGDSYGYDEAKYRAVLEEIARKAELLQRSRLGAALTVASALEQLKHHHAGDFKRHVIALVVVAPFIYNHRGELVAGALSWDEVFGMIEQASVRELEQLYYDLLPDFLAPIFVSQSDQRGYGQVHEATQFVLNGFREQWLQPALRLYDHGNKALSRRTLAIQEVPRPFGLFRGYVARDCSMVSVPYHALSSGARVFWLWKGVVREEQPDGYAFVAETETSPYVITINGPTLNHSDVKAAMALLARWFDSEQLLICSPTTMASVVNSTVISGAMTSFPAAGEEAAVLPSDWSAIDGYRDAVGMPNYYRAEVLQPARRITVGKLELELVLSQSELAPSQLYEPPSDPAAARRIDRAYLCEYILRTNTWSEDESAIRRLFALPAGDVELVRKLRVARGQEYFPAELFGELQSTFGLRVGDLLHFKSVPLLANTVAYLYRVAPQLATEEEWASLVQRTNRIFSGEIDKLESSGSRRGDRLHDLLSYRMALPDRFLIDYWQESSPHLLFADGGPQFYRVHRYVKHFRSQHVVGKFLDLLATWRGQILSNVAAYDSGWAGLFERAQHFFPEHPVLAEALDTIYLSVIEERAGPVSAYDFAFAVLHYCWILGDRGPETFAALLNGASRERLDETAARMPDVFVSPGLQDSYRAHPAAASLPVQLPPRHDQPASPQ